jgi:hypothetical protein
MIAAELLPSRLAAIVDLGGPVIAILMALSVLVG